MVACLHLMASKGWLPERKLQALHDFLAAKSLYAEFNKFIERLK